MLKCEWWMELVPGMAARRVDGVQGARCPKGSAEMAALSRGTNLIWGGH